jgi:hypothetical protein
VYFLFLIKSEISGIILIYRKSGGKRTEIKNKTGIKSLMKKGLLAVIGLLFIFIVVGCDENTSKESRDIKEIVHNYSVSDFENVSASITSHELIVTDSDNKETTYALPEDEFFVSIAPFVETTHDCSVHSLTGCQGEIG